MNIFQILIAGIARVEAFFLRRKMTSSEVNNGLVLICQQLNELPRIFKAMRKTEPSEALQFAGYAIEDCMLHINDHIKGIREQEHNEKVHAKGGKA